VLAAVVGDARLGANGPNVAVLYCDLARVSSGRVAQLSTLQCSLLCGTPWPNLPSQYTSRFWPGRAELPVTSIRGHTTESLTLASLSRPFALAVCSITAMASYRRRSTPRPVMACVQSRRVRPQLWRGFPTVRLGPTKGLLNCGRRSVGSRWRGPETPQRRGDHATTAETTPPRGQVVRTWRGRCPVLR